MQQYFSDVPIEIGDEYIFNKNQAHHAKNVVRLENERVRIVYDGTGYLPLAIAVVRICCQNRGEG